MNTILEGAGHPSPTSTIFSPQEDLPTADDITSSDSADSVVSLPTLPGALAARSPPTTQPSGSHSGATGTDSTLVTVDSSATRAVIPTTAMRSPPPSIAPTTTKVVFTGLTDTPFATFYSALRSYNLMDQITHLSPLDDGSGYILTCRSSRIVQQLLHRQLPAAIAHAQVRLPRSTRKNTTIRGPDLEILMHNVHPRFLVDAIKEDLETQYGVHITYINRIHNRDKNSGDILFDTPSPHVRLRLPQHEASKLLAEPTIKLFACNRHRYTVAGTLSPFTQCKRCFAFNHETSACSHAPRCINCASVRHRSSECSDAETKCANCGGPHRPTYGGCTAVKAARRRITVQRPLPSHLPRHLLSQESSPERPFYGFDAAPRPQRTPDPRRRRRQPQTVAPPTSNPLENPSYPTRTPLLSNDDVTAQAHSAITTQEQPFQPPSLVRSGVDPTPSRSCWEPLQPSDTGLIMPIPSLAPSLPSFGAPDFSTWSAQPPPAPLNPDAGPTATPFGPIPPVQPLSTESPADPPSPTLQSVFKAVVNVLRSFWPLIISMIPTQYHALANFILNACTNINHA